MKTEQELFSDLERLCGSPGYVHALSFLCFRDNLISYTGELTESVLAPHFSGEQLVRTEQSTLIGLLLKSAPIDYSLPTPSVVQSYITQTEKLLGQLHDTFRTPMLEALRNVDLEKHDPFARGEVLREPIFYGGDSAYSFQYRDLSILKYERDDEWLLSNRGFSIRDARSVLEAVQHTLSAKGHGVLHNLPNLPPDQWTMLPSFVLSVREIALRSRLPHEVVRRVFMSFAVQLEGRNEQFRALHDFNMANAAPFIPLARARKFVLLSINSLAEAIYVGPYYWMMEDKQYRATAAKHRGLFAETFSGNRLAAVFGPPRVYTNVTISSSKARTLGEIDVLVVYYNRAIVVQVKSKQLTLESRRGNDNQIRNDFKASVQQSYNQALSCARLLVTSDRYRITDCHSHRVQLPRSLDVVYPLCVVSDHYPALSAQVRTFLSYEQDNVITPPIVLDLFALDVITEMLPSPIRFLSYVDRRVSYGKRVFAHHELTILAYHLKHNLWLDDSTDYSYFHDDFSIALDIAMMVRREGVPGESTPDGILTRFVQTEIGRIARTIEERPEPITIDLALFILQLSEQSVVDLSEEVSLARRRTRVDGRNHDVSIGFGELGMGITLHCNNDPIAVAAQRLNEHCKMRKYLERAATWYGLCIDANLRIRLSTRLDEEWRYDRKMEVYSRGLTGRSEAGTSRAIGSRGTRVGRNDRCPCGSGRKFKHCCIFKAANMR